MKKYDLNLLKDFLLNNSDRERIVLSLNDIEKIVGGKLPEFSYDRKTKNRFWYNNYSNNKSYAPNWLDAGFTASCDLDNQVVIFCKTLGEQQTDKKMKSSQKIYNCHVDICTAINAIKYFHESVNDNYTRYRSWEHCYSFFKENRKDESMLDLLCLNLGFYLASWGMMRGSSKLLDFDYLVHKDFVCRIRDDRYDALYNDNITNIDLIFEVEELIKECYPSVISLTDTLKTKILLGIFGCTPAYDKYFCAGLKKYCVCSDKFNRESLSDLYSYYRLYYDDFEKLRNQFSSEGVNYTPMKMLDMCFWQLGKNELTQSS